MFKKIIVAVLLLHAMASASAAGSLILKVTDSSYKFLFDVGVVVRVVGYSWRGYTDRDGVLRIKDVPENEKFEIPQELRKFRPAARRYGLNAGTPAREGV